MPHEHWDIPRTASGGTRVNRSLFALCQPVGVSTGYPRHRYRCGFFSDHGAVVDHREGDDERAGGAASAALPQIIRGLTGDIAARPSGASSLAPSAPERFTFSDEDDALEAFHARRLTDGLPFVLPTAERVQAMIAGSGRRAGDVIAVVPPRWAEATVRTSRSTR